MNGRFILTKWWVFTHLPSPSAVLLRLPCLLLRVYTLSFVLVGVLVGGMATWGGSPPVVVPSNSFGIFFFLTLNTRGPITSRPKPFHWHAQSGEKLQIWPTEPTSPRRAQSYYGTADVWREACHDRWSLEHQSHLGNTGIFHQLISRSLNVGLIKPSSGSLPSQRSSMKYSSSSLAMPFLGVCNYFLSWLLAVHIRTDRHSE